MKKFLKSFRYGEKGFTLIELLIVVAILGILAALVIPNVGQFMESGKIGAGRAERATLQVAVDGMMADAGAITITLKTGWDGSQGHASEPVVIVDTITYRAGDYVRRVCKGTYDVAVDGTVTCNTYPGLDGDGVARINI